MNFFYWLPRQFRNIQISRFTTLLTVSTLRVILFFRANGRGKDLRSCGRRVVCAWLWWSVVLTTHLDGPELCVRWGITCVDCLCIVLHMFDLFFCCVDMSKCRKRNQHMTSIWHLSDIYLTPIWHLSDTYLTSIWHLSGTYLTSICQYWACPTTSDYAEG